MYKDPFFTLLKQIAKPFILMYEFLTWSSAHILFYTIYLLHQTSEWCFLARQVNKPCHNGCPVPETVRRTEGAVN